MVDLVKFGGDGQDSIRTRDTLVNQTGEAIVDGNGEAILFVKSTGD